MIDCCAVLDNCYAQT